MDEGPQGSAALEGGPETPPAVLHFSRSHPSLLEAARRAATGRACARLRTSSTWPPGTRRRPPRAPPPPPGSPGAPAPTALSARPERPKVGGGGARPGAAP